MDRPNCDTDDRHVIQLKSCPRCNTAIRRSLRYGNVIKQQLHDIEKVKSKVRGESGEVSEVQEKLETRLIALKGTFHGENEMKEWKRLERSAETNGERIEYISGCDWKPDYTDGTILRYEPETER